MSRVTDTFEFRMSVVTQVDFLPVALAQQSQQSISSSANSRRTAAHQQDRGTRAAHQMVGDASVHHAAQSSAPVSAHYDQGVEVPSGGIEPGVFVAEAGEERKSSGIYGWFTEGFDTPHLIDAKSFLEELS